MPADAAALAFRARAQRGLWTRAQARACGYSDSTIQRRVAAGVWRRYHPGVFGAASELPTVEKAMMAAALHLTTFTRDGLVRVPAYVSGAAAAYLWDLPAVPRTTRPEITVASRDHRTPRGVVVHTTGRLGGAHVTDFGGIPVTRVAWTLSDLADASDGAALLEAAGEAWRRHLLTPRQLTEVLDVRPRWRGNQALRWALTHLDPGFRRCRSPLEVRGYAIVVSSPLPRPEVNLRVELPDRVVVFDLAWPCCKVAVEQDSARHHLSEAGATRDRRRDHASRGAGWDVARYGWDDLAAEELFVARLARRLARTGCRHPRAPAA